MWEELFKDGFRNKNDHFLFVCVYGDTTANAPSQPARIPPESRIELLSQPPHGLQIRMNEQEHSYVIKR